VLWAHLRVPESLFAKLPLELVLHVMRHIEASHSYKRSPYHGIESLVSHFARARTHAVRRSVRTIRRSPHARAIADTSGGPQV
jgi:hypothetical protein